MHHNGFQDWETRNVSLWINNDEDLYFDAYGKVTMIGAREAAKEMMQHLKGKATPDGAAYTFNRVYTALAEMDV